MQMLDALADNHPLLPMAAMLVALLLGAFIADRISKFILLNMVRRFAAASAVSWDDILVEHKVFEHVVHLVPAIIVFWASTWYPTSRMAPSRSSAMSCSATWYCC